MEVDERYMRRALELASHGCLDAAPNPMVGAVIVGPDGNIIGEGWHRRCGEGHAEVNAVASVSDKTLLRESTMYVTLEPCSHFGKTPPCADMIVSVGIPKVVVGCLDPFEKVSGRGVGRLRAAGVEVVTGVLEEQCRELNVKFMTAHRLKRPYITLKWAQSADGFIDGHISTPITLMLVHRERALHDAILVGSGTVLADNPSLDTRLFAGKSPVKVILDRRGRVDGDAAVFRGGDTIIVHSHDPLEQILASLYDKGITSMLVEGGAEILSSFINAGLWDAVRVEVGNKAIAGKVKAPNISRLPLVSDCVTVDDHKILTWKK